MGKYSNALSESLQVISSAHLCFTGINPELNLNQTIFNNKIPAWSYVTVDLVVSLFCWAVEASIRAQGVC